MPSVAVIGASTDRSKYGNKAVRAYIRQGYIVYPVNPNASTIEGLRAYKSVLDIPGPVDRVTMYLPPEVGIRVVPEIAEKKPKEFYVNPGAESDELIARAEQHGLRPIIACSMLAVGEDPASFS